MIDLDSIFFHFNVLLNTSKNLESNPSATFCSGYFLRYIIDTCYRVNLILQQDSIYSYIHKRGAELENWSHKYRFSESTYELFSNYCSNHCKEDLQLNSIDSSNLSKENLEHIVLSLQLLFICSYSSNEHQKYEYYKLFIELINLFQQIVYKIIENDKCDLKLTLIMICHIRYLQSQIYLLLPSEKYEWIYAASFDIFTNSLQSILKEKDTNEFYKQYSVVYDQLNTYKQKLLLQNRLPKPSTLSYLEKLINQSDQSVMRISVNEDTAESSVLDIDTLLHLQSSSVITDLDLNFKLRPSISSSFYTKLPLKSNSLNKTRKPSIMNSIQQSNLLPTSLSPLSYNSNQSRYSTPTLSPVVSLSSIPKPYEQDSYMIPKEEEEEKEENEKNTSNRVSHYFLGENSKNEEQFYDDDSNDLPPPPPPTVQSSNRVSHYFLGSNSDNEEQQFYENDENDLPPPPPPIQSSNRVSHYFLGENSDNDEQQFYDDDSNDLPPPPPPTTLTSSKQVNNYFLGNDPDNEEQQFYDDDSNDLPPPPPSAVLTSSKQVNNYFLGSNSDNEEQQFYDDDSNDLPPPPPPTTLTTSKQVNNYFLGASSESEEQQFYDDDSNDLPPPTQIPIPEPTETNSQSNLNQVSRIRPISDSSLIRKSFHVLPQYTSVEDTGEMTDVNSIIQDIPLDQYENYKDYTASTLGLFNNSDSEVDSESEEENIQNRSNAPSQPELSQSLPPREEPPITARYSNPDSKSTVVLNSPQFTSYRAVYSSDSSYDHGSEFQQSYLSQRTSISSTESSISYGDPNLVNTTPNISSTSRTRITFPILQTTSQTPYRYNDPYSKPVSTYTPPKSIPMPSYTPSTYYANPSISVSDPYTNRVVPNQYSTVPSYTGLNPVNSTSNWSYQGNPQGSSSLFPSIGVSAVPISTRNLNNSGNKDYTPPLPTKPVYQKPHIDLNGLSYDSLIQQINNFIEIAKGYISVDRQQAIIYYQGIDSILQSASVREEYNASQRQEFILKSIQIEKIIKSLGYSPS